MELIFAAAIIVSCVLAFSSAGLIPNAVNDPYDEEIDTNIKYAKNLAIDHILREAAKRSDLGASKANIQSALDSYRNTYVEDAVEHLSGIMEGAIEGANNVKKTGNVFSDFTGLIRGLTGGALAGSKKAMGGAIANEFRAGESPQASPKSAAITAYIDRARSVAQDAQNSKDAKRNDFSAIRQNIFSLATLEPRAFAIDLEQAFPFFKNIMQQGIRNGLEGWQEGGWIKGMTSAARGATTALAIGYQEAYAGALKNGFKPT